MWLLVTDAEAQELIAGRVPPTVRLMAANLSDSLEQLIARKQQEQARMTHGARQPRPTKARRT